MTRRLLLVRHGVTTWNREGRFQGHLDPPLDGAGIDEARRLVARLLAEEPEPDRMRIVSSPLQRAMATAEILHALLSRANSATSISSDARLMEIGQGDWEGLTHHELETSDAARYRAWREGDGTAQPPGAEPLGDAARRVVAAVDELTRDAGTPVLMVSHGGILRLAARHLLGLELKRAWSMDVDNASLSRLSREDDAPVWRLDGWNDTSHLLGHAPQHTDEVDGAPLAL
jgi:broad specificity phosphatase PhoE